MTTIEENALHQNRSKPDTVPTSKMVDTTDTEPIPPKKCPVCRQDAVEARTRGVDIYGPPVDYILELQGTKAEMILLRGWYCGMGDHRGVYGTVLAYIENGVRTTFVSPDHAYVLLSNDKISS